MTISQTAKPYINLKVNSYGSETFLIDTGAVYSYVDGPLYGLHRGSIVELDTVSLRHSSEQPFGSLIIFPIPCTWRASRRYDLVQIFFTFAPSS